MSQKLLDVKLADSIFLELTSLLIEADQDKLWLQKITNLLRQYLSCEFVYLKLRAQNNTVISKEPTLSIDDSLYSRISMLDNGIDENKFWMDDMFYGISSSYGFIFAKSSKTPENIDLEKAKTILSLVDKALCIGSEYHQNKKNLTYEVSIKKIQKIVSSDLDIKNQISSVCNEVSGLIQSTRTVIKFFTTKKLKEYDNELSFEAVLNPYLGSISVVPECESEWLSEIFNGDQSEYYLENNIQKNNIELLLSIRSFYGFPITYKNNTIGVITLHQCDYSRDLNLLEKNYIRQIAFILGVSIGKDLERKRDLELKDSLLYNTLTTDDFLRELGHYEIESNIKSQPFSLIMVDIEKLKEINLNLGFVAGNLVLSHTSRFLNRIYGERFHVARYSGDEFVILMKGVDQTLARVEAESLKEKLSNLTVLGVGTVDYNFSFVTYPTHANTLSELLTFLEQGMILSKSRGKFQVSGVDEIQGQSKDRWQQLVSSAIPEIILKRTSLKTGPEIIENISNHLKNQKSVYSADILDSVQSLALALDAKDSYTEGHSRRVSEYAYMLAKDLGLGLQEIEWVRLAAAMHDIGKIGIPESILCKPSKLTAEEYEIMKKHPVIGARILKPIKPLEEVANLVLYHHEYIDGSGYPHGLKGDDIPIGARIVSIVDAYQAMTSNRPYRATLPQEEAVERLKSGAGKQWDSDLIERFIKIIS